MSRRKQVAECGSVSAYRRHLRRGEQPCAPCRDAQAEAQRSWRERSVAGAIPPRVEAGHGSEARYRRHLRNGERPCLLCRAAHANVEAERYRRVRGAA